MRVLYIDIDSQRPDHLGCYGYHRNTSSNIDRIAQDGVRFTNVYISDAPCLPSRTALWSGRCGFRTGVVNHGGAAATPFVDGLRVGHRDYFAASGWMNTLRQMGYKTVTVSPFAARHAAWHWYAGYTEMYNTGKNGLESAHEINAAALPWLKRHAHEDNWFLHVNYWDPHTPYRAPLDFGDPFKDDPLPAWLTEEVRVHLWESFGPHSTQEVHGFGYEDYWRNYPRLPEALNSMDSVKRWIDGYDTGVLYADQHIGQLFDALSDANVLDETVIIISADHGENQGELNVWGDHQTADHHTCNIPLIVRFPGISSRVDTGLHYHFDFAATLIELLGGKVPEGGDWKPFTAAFKEGREADQLTEGRDYLVLSQQTWACQRAVRWNDGEGAYLGIRTYHDGYKEVDPIMLFDLSNDPHEQVNIAQQKQHVISDALRLLDDWYAEMAHKSATDVDPMLTVLREGGPFYTRGELARYAERLRATGRGHHADALIKRHPAEI